MCGKSTFYKSWSIRKMQQDFGCAIASIGYTLGQSKSGDQVPGNTIPVIQSTSTDYQVITMRWGLTPSWANEQRAQSMSFYNARAESLLDKPSFKELVSHKRCIVPVDALYEGHGEMECRFERPDHGTMWLAGLWDTNKFITPQQGCTVITCEPSAIVRPAHHRMPVVLDLEDAKRWLDPNANPTELQALLVPYKGVLYRTAINSKQMQLNFRG